MGDTARTALPPGPRLPAVVQAALMLRDWPRFVSACRRRYGSVFTIRVAMVGKLVYIDDPAEIKKVFAGSPAVYHAGEANAMLGGILGDSSVLVIDDDVHRERRRQMLPAFHRDAVARQVSVMEEVAAANIATWPVNTEFPVAPKMSELTLEVILRTVIGASDPARLAALRDVMLKLLNLTPWASAAIAFPNLDGTIPAGPMASDPGMWRTLLAGSYEPTGWGDIEDLRRRWQGFIVVKGCVSADDAAIAAGIGIDAVQVSNHGGRQLDHMTSPLDILPEIVERVDGRMEIIVDGGIRRGYDIVKALALGADACAIGRPYLYGLAAAGQDGVSHVVRLLSEEMSRTLMLLGISNIKELRDSGRALLRHRNGMGDKQS